MGKQRGKHFTEKAKKEKKEKKAKKEKVQVVEPVESVQIGEETQKIEKKKSKHPILKGFLILIILAIIVVARWLYLYNKRRIYIRNRTRNYRQN